jgi:hypothetical protein
MSRIGDSLTCLPPRLTALDRHGSLAWKRAFYAIPDQRVREEPGYLDVLRNATVEAASAQEFSILTISALVEEARRYKEKLDA